MLIKFTQHSLDRLEERTSLSFYELENIYKAQKTVPLGIEPSSNRQHDLFYSLLDDECYVGVRDVKTHELITILPISYHRYGRSLKMLNTWPWNYLRSPALEPVTPLSLL